MNELHDPGKIRPAGSSAEYEMPFDVISLPSKGLVYPKESSLHKKETIEINYLTAIHEDILTSPNLIQTNKMIPVLLKSVIRDRNIKVDELCLGDRNTILIWLRSTGYGPEYPVRLYCTDCGAHYEYEFNLAELDIKELEVIPDENGLFEYSLPVSKKLIKFRFLNSIDEEEINTIVTSKKKKLGTKINSTLSMKMFKIVQEVDGNEDRGFIKTFIERMPVKDSIAFRKYIQDIEPGVVLRQESKCSECGSLHEEVVPIQANFFWPDS